MVALGYHVKSRIGEDCAKTSGMEDATADSPEFPVRSGELHDEGLRSVRHEFGGIPSERSQM